VNKYKQERILLEVQQGRLLVVCTIWGFYQSQDLYLLSATSLLCGPAAKISRSVEQTLPATPSESTREFCSGEPSAAGA
jgi:hypothetical protein